jgi:hypothetical protein
MTLDKLINVLTMAKVEIHKMGFDANAKLMFKDKDNNIIEFNNIGFNDGNGASILFSFMDAKKVGKFAGVEDNVEIKRIDLHESDAGVSH